jgi:hypothetical protein
LGEHSAYLKLTLGAHNLSLTTPQESQTLNQSDHQQAPSPSLSKQQQQAVSLYRSSLITVDNLRKSTLHAVFNLAHDLRILVLSEKDLTHLLKGKVIAEMFFEPSTRTQCSFTAAVQRLGCYGNIYKIKFFL